MTDVQPSTTIDPGASDELDAARMRALASCPSIDMHGSAGIDAVDGGRLYPEQAGRVHFGAIMNAPVSTASSTSWGRYAIVAIADDVIDCEGGRAPVSRVGTSVQDDADRFRALMRLPRIRMMSITNGGDEPLDPVADPAKPGRFSFRAEFWPMAAGASEQSEPTLGRRCILVLADDLIALGADPEAQAEIASSRLRRGRMVVGRKEPTHGMEQVVDMFERIAARAPESSIPAMGVLQHQLATVEAYVKLTNSMTVVPLPGLRAIKEARDATNAAMRARIEKAVAQARRLIEALPKDRRSRAVLSPISSESELLFAISDGAKTVDHRIREDGEAFELLLDGGLVDAVDAHSISIEKDELVVDGIGRWSLADVVATSSEDGFAFLLASGQLVEIQQTA